MSRTELTPLERMILERSKRDGSIPTTDADRKAFQGLNRRGLLKPNRISVTHIIGGQPVSGSFVNYKTTKAGLRVLRGEPAKKETNRQKQNREWAAETKAGIARGDKCCVKGCRAFAVEGHHAQKKRAGDYSQENRRPLCRYHHDKAESDPRWAEANGLWKSALGTVEPVQQHAPSQRGVA